MKKYKSQVDKVAVSLKKYTEERDELTNKKKEAWRTERDIEKEVTQLKQQVETATRDLQYTMDRELFNGLTAIRKAVKDNNIQGYHGPLIELFTCDEKFRKSVETTAGNSLFHVVVDNDDIGMYIFSLLLLSKTTSSRSSFYDVFYVYYFIS